MVELGTRYKCFECDTKFYDLNKPQPLCPSCGKDQKDKKAAKPFKRKKWRSSFKTEPEIHVVPEDSDALIDPEKSDLPTAADEKDKDGYVLEEEGNAGEEISREDSDKDEDD